MRMRLNQDSRIHINLMRHFVLILFICLTSCKAQKETQLDSGEKDDMILIAQDGYSGIDEYETMVVRDVKSLNKFYTTINKTRKPGLPVPVIDFSKEIVLIVCLGKQKGEITPQLTKSEQEDDVFITVSLSEFHNSNNKENLVTSFPFYIYKLSHTSKKVTIQKSGF